jgi:hypothetical protein
MWKHRYEHLVDCGIYCDGEFLAAPFGGFKHGIDCVGSFKFVGLQESQFIGPIKPSINRCFFLLQLFL